jgi:hypothetical protein
VVRKNCCCWLNFFFFCENSFFVLFSIPHFLFLRFPLTVFL